jgi:hypothetical protein
MADLLVDVASGCEHHHDGWTPPSQSAGNTDESVALCPGRRRMTVRFRRAQARSNSAVIKRRQIAVSYCSLGWARAFRNACPQPAADKPLAVECCLDSRYQFPSGVKFDDVAAGPCI